MQKINNLKLYRNPRKRQSSSWVAIFCGFGILGIEDYQIILIRFFFKGSLFNKELRECWVIFSILYVFISSSQSKEQDTKAVPPFKKSYGHSENQAYQIDFFKKALIQVHKNLGQQLQKIMHFLFFQSILLCTLSEIGLVSFFNSSSCPQGWKQFTKAAGRNLIGAGTNSGTALDGRNQIRIFSFNQIGVNLYAQAISNIIGIPLAHYVFSRTIWLWRLRICKLFKCESISNNWIQFYSYVIQVASQGNSTPSNIMQPYLVLTAQIQTNEINSATKVVWIPILFAIFGITLLVLIIGMFILWKRVHLTSHNQNQTQIQKSEVKIKRDDTQT